MSQKALIVFDLDGTLAASKQSIDADMGQLFSELLAVSPVAVISGGDWPQFERQLLQPLPPRSKLENLFLLPTSGTKFYRFQGAWKEVYADTFSTDERDRILKALDTAITDGGFSGDPTWGEKVEDRGSQITFSGLGQQAPPRKKQNGIPISIRGRN